MVVYTIIEYGSQWGIRTVGIVRAAATGKAFLVSLAGDPTSSIRGAISEYFPSVRSPANAKIS